MKTHFLTLFNIENRKKTLFYLLSSVVLVIASQIVGISDNPIGIAMIGVGVIWFYYSFVHIWKKSTNFVRLIFISLGLMLLEFLAINVLGWLEKMQYLNEGLLMGIFFLICIPMLLVGAFGAFSRPNPDNVTWKWGFIVGIIILAIGIILSPFFFIRNYHINHSILWSMSIVLIVCFPFVLVGMVFIRNHFKAKKRHEKVT
ncbi:MAG: hypothetical protein PHP53_11390 [Prolixibacteraceae bacterium]|nr:hypothetical protein [Prolixibacteraceae bacterium]